MTCIWTPAAAEGFGGGIAAQYAPPRPQYGAPAMSYPASFPTGGVANGGGYAGSGYVYPTVGPTVGTSVQHIHRHIYVYGPPEGDEIHTTTNVVSPGPAQKHYKIIFIKAPSYQTNSQAYLDLAKPPEHKTIVYVLVKKPEEIKDLEVHTPAPTQPSKPEVYFIKYKTKQQTTDGGYTGEGVKPQYGVPGFQGKK